MLSGEENAILDYRYHPSEKLSWYFDHHRTAFASESDQAHFEARRENGRFFYDAAATSCTKLIANVARERFDIDCSALDELVTWADRIDSARRADRCSIWCQSSSLRRTISALRSFTSRTWPRMS